MNALRTFWQSRAPRERAIMMVMMVVLAAALYLWLMTSANRARDQLSEMIMTLRGQAARLEQQAAEYERLRARPAPAASHAELGGIVRARAAASAMMSRAVLRVEPQNPDRVSMVIGAVPFPEWLNWIAELESQHIRLEACRIEALSTPGLVSITATLVRAPPR